MTNLDYFYYDETSKSKLKWKVNRGSHVKVGDDAGYCGCNEYYDVKLNNKCYKVHRIIWCLFYGEIPENMEIDHINGNRLDNSINNLRTVTHKENQRNKKLYSNNVSGVAGVSLRSRLINKEVKQFWRAKWTNLDGKETSKWFSVSKYGYNKAYELACFHRAEALNKLNHQGAGYTERHGRALN